MALEFSTGESSTAFAIELIRRSASGDSELSEIISANSQLSTAEQWRKNYQRAFARLTCLEAQENGVALQRELLGNLHQLVADASGATLTQLTSGSAVTGAQRVITVVIRGDGEVVPLATVGAPTADAMIEHRLAEPGIKPLLENFDARVVHDPELANLVQSELLVAIGANAELSLAPEWLGIGGTLVAVARPNFHKWAKLIETARTSAGTLIVPVLASRVDGQNLAELDDYSIAEIAGLELEDDLTAITNWLIEQANENSQARLNLLGTIYAPGKKQILASAAQDALIAAVLAELGQQRATVGWLATPLDSVLLPATFGQQIARAYAARSLATRIRDAFWQLFGGLKPANFAHCSGVGDAVIADFSAQRQGSSYLLAKRIERWRASVAAAEGFKVWYQVTPAAITHSTVSHKVVRAAYRGARQLGVTAFEPWMLRDLLCAVFIGQLVEAETRVDSNTAIHGGIWRLPYNPQTVWKPAALMGWPELLRKGKNS